MVEEKKTRKIGMWTASAFVIANMIGTGVFTSLGFQLLGTHQLGAVMMLWLFGGVVALCGALTYAELGSAMPRSGGEYHYLGEIYHPSVGFLSGWISLIVGFAAPVALTCMALSSYVCRIFPVLNPKWIALGVLTLITLIHTRDLKFSGSFQNIFTVLKIIVIIIFIACGFILPENVQDYSAQHLESKDIFNPGFAISLIWVYYAYSGWNASTYMASEIENPRKNLPLSLIISTVIVTVLYLLLNYVFLRSTPMADLEGQIEVGLISAHNIFGSTIGNMMGLIISLLLLSSISAMVMITKYTGILLSMCSLLTVLGIFRHRRKFPNIERKYKTLGYPVTPILFCLLILWSIVYLVYEDYTKFANGEQPVMWMTLMSAFTLVSGIIVYFINRIITKKQVQ